MANKVVLAISAWGANDAIRGMVTAYTDSLAALGLSVVHVTADDAELAVATEMLVAGEVAFGITWLGFCQYLPVEIGANRTTANAWEVCNVPLLKIHGDIPAYFQDLHVDTPVNAVNLYPATEFIEYRRRWMPYSRALTALIPPMPIAPIDKRQVDLSVRKRGKLVFLKNGNSPATLRALWHERLPESVARLVSRMADAAVPLGTAPGVFLVGDFVADFLLSEKIEPSTMWRMAPFLTAQLDDYLRRVKSEMIASALLDLPVIVQGDAWEHVDFHNRRAVLRRGADFVESQFIYQNEMGVIDMSPNIDTGGHERIQRAAGSFALALTNRQGWIEQTLPGFGDLMFGFTPESITNRVADVIAHPDRYLELAVTFGERFRQVYSPEAFARRAVDLAELAVIQHETGKPTIQPFFVWPRVPI